MTWPRVAMLVNIPAPYRVPVYDRMTRVLGDRFRVIYMARRETNRAWNVPALEHDHVYLRGVAVPLGEREIHVRVGVTRELLRFRPDVVMTGGFNPPMLAAWAYAQAARRAHIPVSDAWISSEQGLSPAHRLVRRAVYARSQAFVGASHKTLELFRRDGARGQMFVAPLGVDNDAFAAHAAPLANRPFDLMFAGNLIDRKLPLFFADVAARVAARMAIKVLVVGDGPLRSAMEGALKAANVTATFTGYLQQPELPAAYSRAKLFLFPTLNDPWGVVANEASAAGLPVITCENAGCAGELVHDGQTGRVLPLDAGTWAEHAVALLGAPHKLAELGRRAQEVVAAYSFDAASDAMLRSCEAARQLTP